MAPLHVATLTVQRLYHFFIKNFLFIIESKRNIFDQVGEEGLKNFGGGGGGAGAGYTFSADPREIFTQLFGNGPNPFDDMFANGGMPGGGAFSTSAPSNGFMDFETMAGGFMGGGPFGSSSSSGGGFGSSPHKVQGPPVEHTLNLTLEEMYHGCSKRMKISRQVQSSSGGVSKEEKILSVDVKPGWKAGTKVKFEKEGDQFNGKIPSDIVFVIGEKPHDLFSREGNNLRHKTKVTLKNALCGGEVAIPTIEGEKLTHTLGGSTEEMFKGRGMPVSKQPGQRGDLLVNFDILIPTDILPSDQQTISQILSKYQ